MRQSIATTLLCFRSLSLFFTIRHILPLLLHRFSNLCPLGFQGFLLLDLRLQAVAHRFQLGSYSTRFHLLSQQYLMNPLVGFLHSFQLRKESSDKIAEVSLHLGKRLQLLHHLVHLLRLRGNRLFQARVFRFQGSQRHYESLAFLYTREEEAHCTCHLLERQCLRLRFKPTGQQVD